MQEIFNAIEESGKCLAFLGAGVSMEYKKNGKKVKGLPSGGKLAELIAKDCTTKLNGHSRDLDKVSEIFLFEKGGNRSALERKLSKEIVKISEPRPIHTVLAQLTNIKVMLTSNYDLLLEHELTKYNRMQKRHVYEFNNPRNAHFPGASVFFEENEIVLHKMHGSIDTPNSLVITQSDYIRYLATLYDKDLGMPEFFYTTMIPQCTLLFLGYSLQDWNFRVIWEGVLAKYKATGVQRDSYALVKGSTQKQKDTWIRRNVKIIDKDLTEFARELAEYFGAEIPQLGIKGTDKTK